MRKTIHSLSQGRMSTARCKANLNLEMNDVVYLIVTECDESVSFHMYVCLVYLWN